MCNAWNHGVGCDCGWGGDGWPGGSKARRYITAREIRPYRGSHQSHSSYVNPNASCPVCGARVFFYQSPYGGRVFFEELGPPWHKHPCTDKGGSRNAGFTGTISNARYTPSWKAEGWRPIFLTNIIEIDRYFLKLKGLWKGERLQLFLFKENCRNIAGVQVVGPHDLAFLRSIRPGEYELSCLDKGCRAIQVKCFSSQIDARLAAPMRH